MPNRALVAACFVALAVSSLSQLEARPVRVSDFVSRAKGWTRVAVAPPDCGTFPVTTSEVADLVEKWVRASWGPVTVSAEKLQQTMMDQGIGDLANPAGRKAALAASQADALVVVRIVAVNDPPTVPGQIKAPTASITVEVYVGDRDTPVATAQESRGAFSAWGAIERTIRVLLTDLFEGAHK